MVVQRLGFSWSAKRQCDLDDTLTDICTSETWILCWSSPYPVMCDNDRNRDLTLGSLGSENDGLVGRIAVATTTATTTYDIATTFEFIIDSVKLKA